MEPAKQAKVIKEFQKQSAQMDMTVIPEDVLEFCSLVYTFIHIFKMLLVY